ncbi:unnamed protein product, partial [Brassica oleracea]
KTIHILNISILGLFGKKTLRQRPSNLKYIHTTAKQNSDERENDCQRLTRHRIFENDRRY